MADAEVTAEEPERSGGTDQPPESTRTQRGRRLAVRVVRGLGPRPAPPPGCACCGAAAALTRRESKGTHELHVPLCEACLAHLSSPRTRDFAAALASVLLAATLALALPHVAGGLSLATHLLVTLVAASIPPVARIVSFEQPPQGHTATRRPVWWRPDGSLVCTNPHWARALAHADATIHREEVRVTPPRWIWLGAAVAVLAAPLVNHASRPWVRLLNLTGERVVVAVDGAPIAEVEPTSAESPAAGIEVRVVAGQRHFEARDTRGTLLHRADVHVRAGDHHLYAPASEGVCFWLEETVYGRSSATPRIEALVGDRRFWALPRPIDSWFAPNPVPEEGDRRSTGGTLRALRQAPCARAPALVSRAQAGD